MAEQISNFQTAVDAYKEHCDRAGLTFQQPSEELSDDFKGVIYLRVGPGYIARYSLKRNQILN